MTAHTLNIVALEKRMLNKTEAANYTGLSARHFKAICPVHPVEMRPNTLLWDKRDLDRWIDGMKEGADMATQDAILGKL